MISRLLLLACCALLLSACSGPQKKSGGYYQDDGPGTQPPANIAAIPDAVPRIEAHAPANLRPYRVLGKSYVPIGSSQALRQEGLASWYGRKFHGKKTANGETYDMYAMTAAHPTLPLPSYARVTRAGTGQSVIVRINDRGPFHSNRIIDLSYVAAARLGLIGPGSGRVVVEAITHDDIRRNAWQQSTPQPAPAMGPQQAGASGPTQYFLQFGAFSEAANASRLALRLNQQIAHVESRQAQVVAFDQLYRVRIGPYDSRSQAGSAAGRIAFETGHQANTVQVTQPGAPDTIRSASL